MNTEEIEQNNGKPDVDRVSAVVKTFLIDGHKTDIDSQIKAVESLNENLITTPLMISILNSLKELRGIKRNKKSLIN